MVANSEFERGIDEFNRQQFYACHDTLEAVWVDAAEADKRFYQGVLQVAVGCYHLSNDNHRGAVILLGEAVRRLCDYQPDYMGVNVEQLLAQAIALLQALQQLKPDRARQFFELLRSKQSKTTTALQGEANNSPELLSLLANCQLPHIQRI